MLTSAVKTYRASIFLSILFLLTSSAASFAELAPLAPELGIPVPLVALIANPQKYDGKLICTEGLFVWVFEDNAVYLSKEQARHSSLNRIQIMISDAERVALEKKNHVKFSKLNGRWVLVRGEFNAYSDHEGAFKHLVTIEFFE